MTGTVYPVGQLVTSSGLLYRVTTAHTAGGSFDATKFTAMGGGNPATMPTYCAGLTLTHADSWDPQTQSYNITASAFANFRLALAKAKAGVAPCNIAFDSDSIVAGFELTTREVNAIPEQVRAMFQASGKWGNVYEGGPMAMAAADISGANDSRLTWAGGVSAFGGYGVTAGGVGLGGNSGGVITYGPVNCDHFDIYDRLAALPGSPGWTWAIDGGSGTFVAQAGSGSGQGTRKTTVSAGSYGSHTLTITFTNTQYGVVGGISPRKNTDAGGTYFCRRGVGGAAIGVAGTTATIVWNNVVGIEMAYTTMSANLVVINLGTNPESVAGVYTPSLWKSSMISLITTIQARGADVLLVTAPPGGQGAASFPGLDAYLAAIAPLAYQVADQMNVGLLDWYWRWGPTLASATDQYFQTHVHPNQAGADDAALMHYAALNRIA